MAAVALQERRKVFSKGRQTAISTKYIAEPTVARFHRSNARVRCIRGPVGSGKSVGCVMELWKRSLEQAPGTDKVRRTRWAIVRETYPELKATTIKTFQDFIPDEICHIKMDAPYTGMLHLDLPDGTKVEAEFIFIALEKPKDIKKLLSFELTGAWINEAREISKIIVDGVTQRIGRYPGKKYGAPLTWTGLIMDTNSPDDRHWWAKLEADPPKKWEFYVQPAALIKDIKKSSGKGGARGLKRDGNVVYLPNPKAENVNNQQLGIDYWLDMVEGKDSEWIKVYVLNEFGLLIPGQGVYSDDFSVQLHRASTGLWPMKHCDIFMGWDFGLTPACIIGQVTPTGQLRILDELTTERMGIRRFATDVVIPVLKKKYKGFNITSVGDPAGVSPSPTDERTCFEILDEELEQFGIETEPSGDLSNDITARLEAVRWFLTRRDGAGQPALVLDPECQTLIRGFGGGYHYKLVQAAGAEHKVHLKPDKNSYSHAHDALQYLCQEVKSAMGMTK